MSIFYSNAEFQVYNTAYIYMKYSDDQGQTWSDPIILNSMIKSEDIRLFIVGPGRGLQIKNGEYKGRLILPLYQSQRLPVFQEFEISIHCVFGNCPSNIVPAFARSTDGGKTWEKPTMPFHFDDYADTMVDLPAGWGQTVTSFHTTPSRIL